MKLTFGWLVAAAFVTSAAGAQQKRIGVAAPDTVSRRRDTTDYAVRTIALHHLSNNDAAMLLSPYVSARGGVVYPLGSSIHAVTVRGGSGTFAEVERLLAQYDRSPLALSLNFELIAADYANKRDPSLVGLDSVFRSVLKFSGYHLLTVAVVNVSEGSMASQTLSAEGQDYRLSYELTDVSGSGPDATVHVKVSLQRLGFSTTGGAAKLDPVLLSTGVTIPIGHTVVLGSTTEAATAAIPTTNGTGAPKNARVPPRTSAMTAAGSDRALILTVRPQVALPAKDE